MTVTYRADQVGSLLRTPKLLEARTLLSRAQLDQEELARVEDEAILEAMELQRQIGMDVFTDGEYRRTEFRSVFADAVGGMVELPPTQQTSPPFGGYCGPKASWGSRISLSPYQGKVFFAVERAR